MGGGEQGCAQGGCVWRPPPSLVTSRASCLAGSHEGVGLKGLLPPDCMCSSDPTGPCQDGRGASSLWAPLPSPVHCLSGPAPAKEAWGGCGCGEGCRVLPPVGTGPCCCLSGPLPWAAPLAPTPGTPKGEAWPSLVQPSRARAGEELQSPSCLSSLTGRKPLDWTEVGRQMGAPQVHCCLLGDPNPGRSSCCPLRGSNILGAAHTA